MNVDGIIKSNDRITTRKIRIIGNNAQMLRVDTEDTFDLNDKEYESLMNRINDIIDKRNINGIILQDYNKGVLTKKVIENVIDLANKKGIPVGVDPKKKNFLSYRNATLFKPNLKELMEGTNINLQNNSIEEISKAIDFLQEKLNCKYIMTTLSERGVLIKDYITNSQYHIPAHLRKIADALPLLVLLDYKSDQDCR